MFVQSAAAYAERKRKKKFLCVVVMVVESPSLGMFFFRIVGLGWTGLNGTGLNGTGPMHACMHTQHDRQHGEDGDRWMCPGKLHGK